MLIVFLWIASIVCWLWLVVRVFRASGALIGILTLLFWPLAIIDVVRHWNDRDNSVAWPYFATLIASVALYTFALRGINTFLEEQERLAKGDSIADFVDEDDPVSAQIRLQQAFSRLQIQRGEVSIPDAHATLAIPQHFRLIPRRSVDGLMMELGVEPVPDTLFGWLVHDSVELTDFDDAWLIEAHYRPIGHVGESDAADLADPHVYSKTRRLTDLYGAGEYTFEKFAHEPVFLAGTGTLTWGETLHYAEDREQLIDCYAMKPTREGVLQFHVEFMEERRSELCLRSVRLMAQSTRFDRDWGWNDYSFFRDSRSGSDLADLVSGAAFE